MSKPTTIQVAELQRKYTGLDDKLEYVAGHTIDNRYRAYKVAGLAAGTASTTYKKTADTLRQERPYDPNNPAFGPVRARGFYTRGGHQTLAPLAGTASTTAEFYADRRDSFNDRYQDVLEAKGNYKTHVYEATNSRGTYDSTTLNSKPGSV
ncbi:hypothetical protein LX32DRAFT_652843 [Colletotrichum zoysiae]|uniref:Uncharacterized protein n=1 Tax=Colletotrichum zoysiae TaxID=1216348 RepID=A0AAD9HGQ2_9PEZI|nr:hypothetical protein LX32DRAFT_652843 [Colletotrichum zoysiae]